MVSVPAELTAYTKGPRISAARRDRDLMTWRMRQLRKCMLEVGCDLGSLDELRPDPHMWSGRFKAAVQVHAGGVSMLR